ncbi:MFS transporter [Paenarthrobacter nicotinovorans]|uniref:MFS transporter n=1 Tax=Paenarthrobacter nicotinovorans TaxID=29320 RepID=UPI0037F206D8
MPIPVDAGGKPHSTMPSITQAPIRRNVVWKVSTRIIPIVAVLYIFNYMDRANIGYAQLGMGTELAIGAATFGVTSAIFFIGYIIFEIPSNMIMKRVGARIWLARIAVSWGVVTVLTGFITDTTQLLIARILLGIAEAGLLPGLLLYLTFWYRGRERARALAGVYLAQPIALILGSATGGVILEHVHWFDLSSWRWVFVLQGIPAIFIGIITLLVLPNGPDDAKFLDSTEIKWLQEQIDGERMPEADKSVRHELRVLRNLKVLHLGVANIFIASGLYGITFFLPLIVKQLDPGYSLTNIGLLGAIPYAVGVIGMLLVSKSSDLSSERKLHVIILILIAATGIFGAMQFASLPALALTCLSIAAIGLYGHLAPFWAMATSLLSKQQAAVGLAAINCISALGGFFGPYVLGAAASNGNVVKALYFPVGCLLVAAAILAFIRVPREPLSPPEARQDRSKDPR